MNRACHGVHGIGSTEIHPTVSSRTGHANAKPSTAETSINDALSSCPVERDELALACAPWFGLKRMADTAKIALTFLADICDSPHRPAKAQACFLRSAQHPQKSNEACAIVRDSRQVEHAPDATQFEFHVTRENRIEVRSNDQRIGPGFSVCNNDIAE